MPSNGKSLFGNIVVRIVSVRIARCFNASIVSVSRCRSLSVDRGLLLCPRADGRMAVVVVVVVVLYFSVVV